MMFRKFFFFVIFCILLTGNTFAQVNRGLTVFDYWTYYSDAENAQYKSFCNIAFKQLEKRKQDIAELSGTKDWKRRRETVRDKLNKIAGVFPDKPPLNVQITGQIDAGGFTIEKLVYESRPGYYVTAVLYIPGDLNGKKAPGILYCSGHTEAGFRHVNYQHICQNLVKKGFVVLAFDPIGQGERYQYYIPEKRQQKFSNPTEPHNYAGAQCFISGQSIANYFTWDGIRGIDYLVSRKEVDPGRIGVAGRSGGGTQTAYIGAFDKRVKAACSENYITNYQTLLKSRKIQDCEQNFFHGLKEGLDHADYLLARAPKATQILATSRDIFSMEGVMETYQEAKKGFEALGAGENLVLSVDDDVHSTTKKNREALYGFFSKHLDHPCDTTDETNLHYFSIEQLRVTSCGQVSTAFDDAKSAFDLNKDYSKKLIQTLNSRRTNKLETHLKLLPDSVIKYTGYTEPKPKRLIFSGRFQRKGYKLEKYFIEVNSTYGIPFLLYTPEIPGQEIKGIILHLHPDGKTAEAEPGERMEWLVKQGYVIVAPDVRGTGELSGGYVEIFYRRWQGGVITGTSITGQKMQDIAQVLRTVKEKFNTNTKQVIGIGYDTESTVLLHQAVISEQIGNILLINPLISYESVVMEKHYEQKYVENAVPGMLEVYDLPDLVAAHSMNKVWLVNTMNAVNEQVTQTDYHEKYPFIKSKLFNYQVTESKENINIIIKNWLNK
jgi:dienelactone hydrolase